MAWLRETYGERNVVAAVLHRDELTPHIQALVVPIDDNGRLNARGYIGGERGRLAELQDSYHEAVGRLGLARGVRGSVADHQTVKEYYTKISEPTPARGTVLREVEIERPGRLTRDLDRWAEEQREKVVERIAPALDAALTKARHYEGQAARAEANVVALQERVRALEQAQERLTRDYRAFAERVRDIPLPDVLKALGASQDRSDAHKWHTEAGVLNVTGAKFYSHSEGRGGGGAIDLVEHIAGYDFKGATAYLSARFGADAAAGAAVTHQTAALQRWAARSEPPAFEAPAEDARRWGQVRAYLVEERCVPEAFVDALHEKGFVYADRRGNAVFPRWDEELTVVGAALRGTDEGSAFKGLAAGSRREEGHWAYSSGLKEYPDRTPTLLLAESPIDAISVHLLRYQGAPVRVVSTDGAGALPAREIAEAREQGWAIRGRSITTRPASASTGSSRRHAGAPSMSGASGRAARTGTRTCRSARSGAPRSGTGLRHKAGLVSRALHAGDGTMTVRGAPLRRSPASCVICGAGSSRRWCAVALCPRVWWSAHSTRRRASTASCW
jgi:hypothetical protein